MIRIEESIYNRINKTLQVEKIIVKQLAQPVAFRIFQPGGGGGGGGRAASPERREDSEIIIISVSERHYFFCTLHVIVG